MNAKLVSLRDIPTWLLLPAAYTIITLFRGYFVSWYPYPFFDLNKYGIGQIALNSLMLLIVFSIFAATLVLLGNRKALPSR
ncbi:Pr6Pr family membrane protein [Dyadobacter sp. CY347]|uniref:Pr6Pr family membrane protein n=1 Tax=Dyadobacter sp. CY347 TaxID=2909336 RepID=UPI0038D49DBF